MMESKIVALTGNSKPKTSWRPFSGLYFLLAHSKSLFLPKILFFFSYFGYCASGSRNLAGSSLALHRKSLDTPVAEEIINRRMYLSLDTDSACGCSILSPDSKKIVVKQLQLLYLTF